LLSCYSPEAVLLQLLSSSDGFFMVLANGSDVVAKRLESITTASHDMTFLRAGTGKGVEYVDAADYKQEQILRSFI
jgi:hypothetical protein